MIRFPNPNNYKRDNFLFSDIEIYSLWGNRYGSMVPFCKICNNIPKYGDLCGCYVNATKLIVSNRTTRPIDLFEQYKYNIDIKIWELLGG
jgi:hypothetical protein